MVATYDPPRCPSCRNKRLEKTEEEHTCECGCTTHFEGQILCSFHAMRQGRCKVCGQDIETAETAARNKAERSRRKRELRTAVAEKDKVRDITTAVRRRTRKECGKVPPVRQRHRAFAR